MVNLEIEEIIFRSDTDEQVVESRYIRIVDLLDSLDHHLEAYVFRRIIWGKYLCTLHRIKRTAVITQADQYIAVCDCNFYIYELLSAFGREAMLHDIACHFFYGKRSYAALFM